MFYFILYLITQLILLAAWVSGTLDPYQKRLQEILLDQMGETKVSYGLKSRSFIIILQIIVILFVPSFQGHSLIHLSREPDSQETYRR